MPVLARPAAVPVILLQSTTAALPMPLVACVRNALQDAGLAAAPDVAWLAQAYRLLRAAAGMFDFVRDHCASFPINAVDTKDCNVQVGLLISPSAGT